MPQPWKNSLFNCMPCGICMKGFCCPCILVGQNHERIHKGERRPATFSGWCIAWWGLAHCFNAGFVLPMLDRMEMHEKFDLQGGGCGACCSAYFCACCDIIQTSKELDYIQSSQDAVVGYVPQEKMVMQPLGQV